MPDDDRAALLEGMTEAQQARVLRAILAEKKACKVWIDRCAEMQSAYVEMQTLLEDTLEALQNHINKTQEA